MAESNFPVPSDNDQSLFDCRPAGLVTAADFARIVGYSIRAVQKWAQHGRVRAIKPSWCHQWLIYADEAARIADKREVARG